MTDNPHYSPAEADIPGFKIQDARDNVFKLMRQYRSFGAEDTEPRYHLTRVECAAREGKPFPIKGHNPWELYTSTPGWEAVSHALTDAALSLWRAVQGIEDTPAAAASDVCEIDYKAVLEFIANFDPEEEYREPIDEWIEARAFGDVKDRARIALGMKPIHD